MAGVDAVSDLPAAYGHADADQIVVAHLKSIGYNCRGMKLIPPFISIFLFLLAAWVAWNSSLPRLWKWLGARPAGQFPVWRQVRERLEEVARRERIATPRLWILPDFSPNALVLRTRKRRIHIALTEGLLRSLEEEELEAILLLCILHGAGARRRLQTAIALQIFPFARLLQSYSVGIQLFFTPWFSVLLRLVGSPSAVLRADRKGLSPKEALVVAAALQKMAVLGRKIPLRLWNIALDSLFLISPLVLDGGPFWIFLSQPSLEQRRQNLMALELPPACESTAGLP
jgi:Zn-dependent protease with chaperone function